MVKKVYYGNESLGLAWDCLKVCQVTLFNTTKTHYHYLDILIILIMAASAADVLCLLILILCSFCVTKVFYSESDGISISITGATNKLENISLLPILSASSRNGLKVNFRRKSLFCLLLLLCGDIESCPGPETSYTNISNFLTRKGFTALHQNIRGLHGKKFIISDILSSNTIIDIFFLSETFISPDDVFDSTIRGFDFESESRSNGDGSGDGVGAYIKNGIPYARRVDLETDDLEII